MKYEHVMYVTFMERIRLKFEKFKIKIIVRKMLLHMINIIKEFRSPNGVNIKQPQMMHSAVFIKAVRLC